MNLMKKYLHSKWTSVEKINGWRHYEVKNVFVKIKELEISYNNLMLVYEDEQVIYDIDPDFSLLKKFDDFIIVTAKSKDSKYDFVSRFFCADDGISEDPVTGSSHSTLAPYWAKIFDKNILKAYQASKRGGELWLEVRENRVMIEGDAVTVITGKINF